MGSGGDDGDATVVRISFVMLLLHCCQYRLSMRSLYLYLAFNTHSWAIQASERCYMAFFSLVVCSVVIVDPSCRAHSSCLAT